MKTIVQIFFIAAVLFLAYAIATADGPLVVTTDNPQQQQAPQVIFIPAPVVPTAQPPQQVIIIPNPPNPADVMALTAVPQPTPPPASVELPQEAVFLLTDNTWVDDANAQFLTDCAYNIAKGLAHDPMCPVNSAELLGVGR